ncbi:COX aromatic rich motif-containing protein, partial [Cupriavidus sp. SIMBA_020]
ARAQASPAMLSRGAYERLAIPGEKTPVTLYSNVAPGLFEGVVDKYMRDVHGNPICGTGANVPALTLERSGARAPAILAAE